MRFFVVIVALVAVTSLARGQFEIERSPVKTDLLAVSSLSERVAWASGAEGTIDRTENGGRVWLKCGIPADGEKLDFCGVQAFAQHSALIFSGGKANLWRIYATVDGCRTWNRLFDNPDKEGSWVALLMSGRRNGWLVGWLAIPLMADSSWKKQAKERRDSRDSKTGRMRI